MRSVRVTAVAVLLLLLVACSGAGGADTVADEMSGGSVAAGGAGEGAVEDEAAGMSALREQSSRTTSSKSVALGGEGASAAQDGGEDAVDPGAEPPAVQELPEGPALRPGDRIIKEGTISVEVGEGAFDRAFIAVITAARTYDGDVVGSSTKTAENGDTFGSVTVRVPVANFEDLVVGVGDIGTVRNRDVASQDVSAEFTDLESRLRHLQAQERFYLGLFDKADSVQDAISVQQQLDGIQSQIERVQGRLNFLDDRTSFSTLTVELFEPGAGEPLDEAEEPTDRPSLAHYWDTARDAFVNVVGGMLVVFLFLLPLLVPLAVVGALWLARRRSRPPVAPQVRRDSEDQQDDREPVSADR